MQIRPGTEGLPRTKRQSHWGDSRIYTNPELYNGVESPDKVGTDSSGYSDKRAAKMERASFEDDLRR